MLNFVILMALFFAIFYFMLIRPQSKRAKEHRAMLAALAVGDEVVTGGGILGKVAEVKGSTATIDLLTKPGVKLGVATKLGTLGTVEGQGPNRPLVLELQQTDTKLRVGDPIYTSGIDRSAIPGDLPVGRVSKVIDGGDGVAPRYEVEPSADLTSRYVKVVLKEPPP